MNFVELTSEEFRKFEQKNPFGNLYQMSERAEVRKNMGWNAKLLGLKDDKKIVAGCLLLERGGAAMVQMGGILDWSDTKIIKTWVKELVNFAKKNNYYVLEVYPPIKLSIRDHTGAIIEEFDQKAVYKIFEEQGFSYIGKTTEIDPKANRWITMKDLSGFKTVEELRSSYKKNVRNKLRKCSADITIREVTSDADLEKIAYAIEGSNEKNGMKSRAHDYYRYIRDAYGNQVHFVLAERKEDGATVAGRVIFDHPNETISFISGTVQEHRRMNAMTVLQDDLLTKCFNKGVKRVNFYGMAGDFSSANRLLEFKSGFGIKVEEYIGGFRCVLNPGKYRMKKIGRGAKVVVSGALRRAKALPEKLRKRKTHVVRKVDAGD